MKGHIVDKTTPLQHLSRGKKLLLRRDFERKQDKIADITCDCVVGAVSTTSPKIITQAPIFSNAVTTAVMTQLLSKH